MTSRRQTVHVRVNDAATGKPTPVRIRFTDADGNYHAPFGRLSEFATGPNQDVGGNVLLGMKPFAYIDGACEIALPPGRIKIQISKGPEFVPYEDEIDLHPGKLALRLTIERWINQRERGWYAGDMRVQCLSPHAAVLEAAAEDVAVVNLLAREYPVVDSFHKTALSYPNILAFSGQRPIVESAGHLVVVNTYNSHPELGSLALLNCHRVVYPLSFGGKDELDDWTLAAWCDQCHRKNGLVVWTNTMHESADFEYGEPLVDLILGKVDAFELAFFADSPFDALQRWYNLLNAGLRVPLAGASGKDSNGQALGAMRAYAQLAAGEDFSYANWIEAVRAGRTFITNGPLVEFSVNDFPAGRTINLEGERTVIARATARSSVTFEHLELVVNGTVVGSAAATGQPCSAQLETVLSMESTSWIAVRCRGQTRIADRPANQRVFAHTSPVYVRLAGKPNPKRDEACGPLRDELQKMLAWARDRARCETDQQRLRLTQIFEDALAKLQDSSRAL